MSAEGNTNRNRVSGWTAFDLNQRRKQQPAGLESENAYPSLSSAPPQTLFNKDFALPYSSVLVASMNFPPLKDDLENGATSCSSDAIQADHKLNCLYPWADKGLIQDVLAAVNNNFDEALSLLEPMLQDDKNKSIGSHPSLGEKEEPLDQSYNQFLDDEVVSSIQLPYAAGGSLPIIPEPEWEEEDDVYLIHRKDAIRMKRSASRFSKVANDAYMRGDHTVARHFSLKAKHEWSAAEKLNAKAAEEILNARNCKNDIWTLDLHGLHAAEAVEALRVRLWTVESVVSPKLYGIQKEPDMLQAPHVQPTGQFDLEKVGSQIRASRQRITLLQVITGKGNHSKGEAALPAAIRNFLNENGYRFEETRPGVVMIRPKFRQR